LWNYRWLQRQLCSAYDHFEANSFKISSQRQLPVLNLHFKQIQFKKICLKKPVFVWQKGLNFDFKMPKYHGGSPAYPWLDIHRFCWEDFTNLLIK